MVSSEREPRTLGIIGTGTIARAVAERVAAGAVPGLSLLGFLARTSKSDLPAPAFGTVDGLLRATVVVEAAGREAVEQHAEAVLGAGRTLVCCSVGALVDEALRTRLVATAARAGSRLIVPSGAVGGLDLLRAAAEAGLDEVVVEQRKPATTLLHEAEAAALCDPCVVFEGSVADVVGRYPKTTNVAAAVALASLGFERTRARVIADPSLRGNQVLLSARGRFGELHLRLDNVASANPSTSSIVAHSVVATLRRLSDPLVVPG
jgi:aspartate dehydrogenase